MAAFLKTLLGFSCLFAIVECQIVLPETTLPPIDRTTLPPVEDVRDLCATTRCREGSQCRVIYPCDDCPPAGRCVLKSTIQSANIDDVCRRGRYLESLLVVTSTEGFKQRKRNTDCPLGSVCITYDKGEGSCCTGKPTEKQGICPYSEIGVCGGELCEFDNDCSGDRKCCDLGCGLVCTEPVLDESCGQGQCSKGETCVLRQPECEPGLPCIKALIPTCVPEACADCRLDQECRRVKNDCGPEMNCPNHKYFCGLKSYKVCDATRPCARGEKCEENMICASPPQGFEAQAQSISSGRSKEGVLLDPYCADVSSCIQDECDGCPEGQECKDTGSTFQCVDLDKCGGCRQDEECRSYMKSLRSPEYHECAPKDCLTSGQRRYGFTCFWWYFKPQCTDDAECDDGELCCMHDCGVKTCLKTQQTPFGRPWFVLGK